MEIPHKDYLIVPGARDDDLGRWMPVISVRSRPMRDGAKWGWPPQTIVSERHNSRGQAEQRSVEIAKQMIDRGVFKPRNVTRLKIPPTTK